MIVRAATIAGMVAASMIVFVSAAIGAESKPPPTAPSVRAGAAIAAECAMCHGSNGISVAANIPNLAGQHYDYLLAQLKKFKSGAIKSPIMNQMAESLSEQQMQDIAAYFASIPIKVGAPKIKSPKTGKGG